MNDCPYCNSGYNYNGIDKAYPIKSDFSDVLGNNEEEEEDQEENYRISNTSYIRVLHAIPDAPPVDIYINNKKIIRGLSYKQFTQYLPIKAGTYTIKVVAAGTNAPALINVTLPIPPNSILTVAAIGSGANISLFPILEPSLPKNPNKVRIRFIHLSPNAPNVDVALPNGTILFKNISFKGVTPYLDVMPGVYVLDVYITGTKQRVLHVPNIRLLPNRYYSVYAVGLAGKNPPLKALIPLDGNSYKNF